MDTARIYYDVEGNERTIHQMVKEEPVWAANRVQEGGKAIERVAELEKALAAIAEQEGATAIGAFAEAQLRP